MPYLLDADVFIQAKNLHYGLDFCPAFWDWVLKQHAAGQVYSVRKIGEELEAGHDDLATWAAARGDAFFLPPDAKTLSFFGQVSTWVTGAGYTAAAINSFLQAGDYYLTAQALEHRYIVVTHEVPAPSTRKVKIPNVCIALGVPYLNPFEMLRKERARFVLG